MFTTVFVLAGIVFSSEAYVYEDELLYDKFPDDFVWGVATSSYQIEGGWNEGGKGVSIWDTFVNETGTIYDGSDGTVACDSYHKYKEDVGLIKGLGVNSYRFSIAWARIQPSGEGEANPEGVQYYKNLIAELKANGIEPAVTLYHWDLPQALEDQGGWLNPKVADWFEEYARICFREFGDDVKFWITLNEPWVQSIGGYGDGLNAPGIQGIGTAVYESAHNQLRAHGKAYRLYESEFASSQHGRVGITLNIHWCEPLDPTDPDHLDAVQRSLQFHIGWFAHPIFVDGEYPPIMRELIDAKSEAQGFETSRLPSFSAEESGQLLGSADFLGINFYTSDVIAPSTPDIDDVSYYADSETVGSKDSRWYKGGSSWLYVTPWGIREMMNWLSVEYGSGVDIYITENGISDNIGNLDDLHRIYYYKHYLNNLLKAIKLDGINVKGYFAWSLMDNFEWARGYSERFGLHAVDFGDPERPRTPKASAQFLKQLVMNNGFSETPSPCEPGL